ncbi:MAG: polyribonucleotide nucleotidyltransferase [Candidatus Shikimatogenerans sp. Tser]|uniref:Polyribonucleotide nucleotidyltransferase n=1 Tax=Candidatus Shikimatogenerans sp. Tser TaxID=3158568 RepID=A0AAU7QT21_9FLAO
MIIKNKNLFLNKKKILLSTGFLTNNLTISLQIGNTNILGIIVNNNNNKIKDFLPLSIIYKEKTFALNKIPFGYIKKENKYSNREILMMRVIDRLVRPLIQIYIKEIQITLLLLSYDKKFPSDSLLSIITSLLLYIKGFTTKLIYQIRIIKIGNKYIINPSLKIINNKNIKINLLIGGDGKYITVMEGDMKQVSYKELKKIIIYANKIIIRGIILQKKFLKKYYFLHKKEKRLNYYINKFSYIKRIINKYKICIKNIFFQNNRNNKFYYKNINNIKNKILKIENIKNKIIFDYFFNIKKKNIFNKKIIYFKKRLDNRNFNKIRKIKSKINYLAIPHGSCLFFRGNTKILVIVTLSTINNINIIDTLDKEYKEKFYIFYNFNDFSVQKINKSFIISRREIGHGYLAQKSFKYLLFNNRKYIIRVVSEVLESNGSTSMATVCATNMALLNAGVILKNNISGISYGILKYKKKKIILTDISEIEDYYGYIDFKITGTKKGFTSCQIDIKDRILNIKLIKNILKKSSKDLKKIIIIMNKIIKYPSKIYIFKFFIHKKFMFFFNEYNIFMIKNNNNLHKLIINYFRKKKKIYLISKNKYDINKILFLLKNKIFFLKKKFIYRFKIHFITYKGIYIKLYNIFYFLKKKYLYLKYKYIYYFLKVNDYINLIYINIFNNRIFISRNFI